MGRRKYANPERGIGRTRRALSEEDRVFWTHEGSAGGRDGRRHESRIKDARMGRVNTRILHSKERKMDFPLKRETVPWRKCRCATGDGRKLGEMRIRHEARRRRVNTRILIKWTYP